MLSLDLFRVGAMVNRFRLPVNAQFFKKQPSTPIHAIRAIINDAKLNIKKSSQPILDVGPITAQTKNGSPFNYYALVYLTERPVHFFKDSISDDVYAFIVVIEIGNWVAIVKKSTASISSAVAKAFELASVSNLTSSLDDSTFAYQQVAVRTMTVSSKEVRAKSYEADNLNGILSPHMTGRSILSRIKVRKGMRNRVISVNTGRMAEQSERVSLEDLALWAEERIAEFKPSVENNFVSMFAKNIEFRHLPTGVTPKAIFFDVLEIFEELERIGSPLFYERPHGKIVYLHPRQIRLLQSKLNRVYEINARLQVVNHEDTFSISSNSNSITFRNKWLSEIKINDNGKSISLLSVIRNSGCYGVCFSDPEYMYFNGKCFHDQSAVSAVDQIKSMLEPLPDLKFVTSEKGSFSKNHVAFDPGSVFNCIEKHYSTSDYVFCDDLGNEWADHIVFELKNAYIIFIHSKHGHISSSASNLHDVIGQAMKNIGNMKFTENMFLDKWSKKFNSKYTSENVSTKIKRLRFGDGRKLKGDLKILLSNHQLNRKCILACSFLSKQQIEKEFNKIKNNKPVKGHVIQLLWILSSFMHTSKESGIIPTVYCSP